MPDGIVYSIKDSQARKDIEDIKKNSFAGSGGPGGVADVEATLGENDTLVVNMTVDDLADAMQKGARIYITASTGSSATMTSWFYLGTTLDSGTEKTIRVFSILSSAATMYEGTEQDGKTVFSVVQVS